MSRDVGRIEVNARYAQQTLTAEGLSIGGPPGAARQDIDAAALSAIKRNGYWVTNHDVSGLILFSERGVPVLKNGRPVMLTWGELEKVRTIEVLR